MGPCKQCQEWRTVAAGASKPPQDQVMVGGEGETNCRLEPELSGAYELLGRLENKPLVFLAH